MVNYKEINIAAPVVTAVDQTPFPWLKALVKFAILTGLTSVILVLLLGQSRILYTMAADGMLPAIFSKTLHKRQTPWVANIALMLFVGSIAAFVPIQIVGQMTSIGTLLAFAYVCAGVLILRYREPHIDRPFKVPAIPWIPLLGIATCLLMMVSLDWQTWLRLVLWLALGIIIYFSYSRYHIKA